MISAVYIDTKLFIIPRILAILDIVNLFRSFSSLNLGTNFESEKHIEVYANGLKITTSLLNGSDK